MDEPPEKHYHKILKFPDDFLWGSSTSSFQVEGENTNSDWWRWEQTHQPPEKRSGKADDQYNRYEEDFDWIKNLSQNAHRLSIEWSRIEPHEGEFDASAIEHYKKVLQALEERDIQVCLTLHHFSNPEWFIKKGGWKSFKAPFYFERFVKRILPEYKDFVKLWITINEPQVYVFEGFLTGNWPPQEKSLWSAFLVTWQLSRAHKKAYKIIHKFAPNAKVGIANNVTSIDVYHHHSFREILTQWLADIILNHLFYKLTGTKTHDFLGINYYFNKYISFNGEKAKLPSIVDISKTKKEVSDMGWEIYPEGIFDMLMDLSDYHKPIYITENGLASTNDDRRCRFLVAYLQEVYHAIQAGADVRGYFHWALIDNFEWVDGFTPRFGLIEVDYETEKRNPRPSAYVYQDIIRHNGLAHHILRFLGHTVSADEVLKSHGE